MARGDVRRGGRPTGCQAAPGLCGVGPSGRKTSPAMKEHALVPYVHAQSSARRFGGEPSDYVQLHEVMDMTKGALPDSRHRMMLHNAMGIHVVERCVGPMLERASDGALVPVRAILEQHIVEDLGFIPTLEEAFSSMELSPWMSRRTRGTRHQRQQRIHRHSLGHVEREDLGDVVIVRVRDAAGYVTREETLAPDDARAFVNAEIERAGASRA